MRNQVVSSLCKVLKNWRALLFRVDSTENKAHTKNHIPLEKILSPFVFCQSFLQKSVQCIVNTFEYLEKKLHHINSDRYLSFVATQKTSKWLTIAMTFVVFVAAAVVMMTPLSLTAQFVLAIFAWLAILCFRSMQGRFSHLLLITFSLLMTGRYIWWRATNTLALDTPLEHVLAYMLFAAEVYTWLVLLMGHAQIVWPFKRKPVPLPEDIRLWPTVDVFIATYNEPLSVVKSAVYAAKGLDWPQDKLNIYLLDDGHRGEFRDFAQQISVHYIARENRAHAKAGNLNHALTKARGEYIAFFDCDHIVARSFLQVAMGWFFKDPQYALVQTPHHFFSPDPFERNLGVFRKIPSESNLFYGLVQQGNDFWNASFFCGSCAVMKREALEKVGGFSTASITEDAHTTLRMHRLGYKTAYLSIPQAAGLAVESLAAHIVQRARWAKGMTQIFRKDNPFWGRGLSFMQRVCYSSSLFHFLYGIPRMIFLTMPMAYLYFGLNVLNTVGWEILFYVIPHILLLYIVNVRTQGTYRNPFWAPIYEVIMAWYVIGPTLQALIHPKIGKFKVTVKGHRIQYEFVDWTLSIPYLVVIFINLSGVLSGVYHLWGATMVQLPAIVLNTAWALANLLILGAAIGVAAEARQIRVSHHIQATIPATLFLEDGRALQCYTEDYSKDGVGLVLSSAVKIPENSNAHILLKQGEQEFAFPARIVHSHVQENMQHLGLSFYSMNVQQEMQWTQVTFGRADAWLHEPPIPAAGFIRGMFGVSQMGFRGYVRLFASIKQLIEKRGVLRFKYRTR